MPLSATCKLSKDHQPVFPNRCVVCRREEPGATARLAAKGPSRNIAKGWFSVSVPACLDCGSRLRWQATWRFLRAIVVAGVAMGGAAVLLYGMGFRDAALGGISFAVLLAAMIVLAGWEMLHPPEFKIEVGSVNVEYAFRDREYAREFAELNGLKFH